MKPGIGIGIDSKNHNDLVFVDFDALDQGADDLALGIEIDRAQPIVNCRGKLFESIDHQEQLELARLLFFRFGELVIHLL